MTRRKDRELDEEIRSHLEMAVQDRVEEGEPRTQAEAAARRELGNVALIKEATRDVWGWIRLERLVQDLRYGARLLRRSPSFTVVALLSLALGIGANTAIFQVINAVRLRPLAVADPGTLALIRIADMTGARGNFNSRHPSLTNPVWEQLRRDQQAFAGVVVWNRTTFNLAPGGVARPVRGLWVSGSFFEVLGIPPAAGRVFTATDDLPGCAPRAVISHGFWQSGLGGRPVVGTTLTLDGHSVEIAGVSAQGFSGVEVGNAFDVAVPVCAQAALSHGAGRLSAGTDWWLTAMGRLKKGWTIEQASAHLATISPGVFRTTLPADYPAANVNHYLGFRLEAVPGATGLSGLREDYLSPLWLLLCTAALVLVIACVNLANLMLARGTAREREFAVRLGLGASRGRIIRQLLVESLLLAGIGAACGTVLARFLSGTLISFLDPAGQSISLDLALDWRVLAFTALVAILTCVLFGVVPALRATRVSANAVLQSGGRSLTASPERLLFRRALVAFQVALSLLLLTGALLFARTLDNLLSVDPGFIQDGVVIAGLDLRAMRIPATGHQALRAGVLERVRATPGVQSAAEVAVAPVSGDAWGNNVWMDDGSARQPVNALLNRVSRNYFETLGIPLLAGRDFADADTATTPLVAIVNETFVKTVANGVNPVGLRMKVEATPFRPETAYNIVGVARDAKYLDLRQEPLPIVFFASTQAARPGEFQRLVVRSNMAPTDISAAIANSVRELSPAAVLSFTVLEAQVAETLVRERLMANLSGFFGFLAALLAVVGLYGVIAYTVARRTREIGVRMALGANRPDVLRLILREAFLLITAGIIAGLALTLVLGRAAATLLFGLKPSDPGTIALAAGLLTVIALAASYLPARGATRIEPVVALRGE